MWSKYGQIFQLYFQKRIQYRTEIVVWMLLDIIPTAVVLWMWLSIFQTQSSINGYTLSEMINYFALVVIINGMTASHFESQRVQQIRNGKIDLLLTKPFSYLQDIFIDHFAGKVFYTLISLPFYLFCWWLFMPDKSNFGISLSAIEITQLLLLLTFGFLIEFIFALITVLLGFWFEGSEGLEHFKWIIVSLGSGSMIPIALMPGWLQTVTHFSPLKYMFAIPINIIQGRATLTSSDLLYMTLTVISCTFLSLKLWDKAKYRYASAGG